MTENEAIKVLETSINLTKMCTQNYERKREIQGYEMAINALEDVMQYRALEKRLSDMFCSSVSLKSVVDELERNLKEPDSPHPMKARILTYKESADWDAYRAIGTPEECRAAVEKQKAKKPKEYEDKFYGCPACGNVLLHKWEKYPTKLMNKKNGLPYCLGCGQKLDWSDEE